MCAGEGRRLAPPLPQGERGPGVRGTSETRGRTAELAGAVAGRGGRGVRAERDAVVVADAACLVAGWEAVDARGGTPDVTHARAGEHLQAFGLDAFCGQDG